MHDIVNKTLFYISSMEKEKEKVQRNNDLLVMEANELQCCSS
jgi:hypothetical protein